MGLVELSPNAPTSPIQGSLPVPPHQRTSHRAAGAARIVPRSVQPVPRTTPTRPVAPTPWVPRYEPVLQGPTLPSGPARPSPRTTAGPTRRADPLQERRFARPFRTVPLFDRQGRIAKA